MNPAPRFLYFPDLIVNLEEIAAVYPGTPEESIDFVLRSGEHVYSSVPWETVVARLQPVIDAMGVLGPAGKEPTP